MKKYVWVFNHYAVTPDMSGGTRHFELAKELVKKGYDVTIFASSFSYNLHQELRLKNNEKYKTEIVDGVRFIWIKTSSYSKNDVRRVLNMFSYAIRIFFLTKKIKKLNPPKPDVVIGSSVHLLTPLSAYFIAKRYAARSITEIRDIWPQTLIDMEGLKKNGIAAKILFAIENFIYRKADKIITLLPNSIEYFVNKGVDRSKINLIPNGVNFSNYNNIKEYDGGKTDLFTIMYIGAHGRANALDVIIDAAEIIQDKGLNNIRFEFIGDGPEKQSLIEQAKNNNLINILFKENVPKNMISKVIGNADAFIVSLENIKLYRYGISLNKLFDYLGSGRPVILSGDSKNNPVEIAKAGIIAPPRDPQALADAIIKLISLPPEERIQMGKNGKEYVRKNHDYSLLATKLINTIEI